MGGGRQKWAAFREVLMVCYFISGRMYRNGMGRGRLGRDRHTAEPQFLSGTIVRMRRRTGPKVNDQNFENLIPFDAVWGGLLPRCTPV